MRKNGGSLVVIGRWRAFVRLWISVLFRTWVSLATSLLGSVTMQVKSYVNDWTGLWQRRTSRTISLFRMFCILTLVRQIVYLSWWLSSLSRGVIVRLESGFEEMWFAHADCERVVQQGWYAGSWLNPTTRFEKRQSSTSLKLRTWSSAEFGNTARRLSDLLAKLAVLFRAPYSSSLEDEKRVVQGDLNALLQMGEIYWRQRSRAIWLKTEPVTGYT
ncbi:hypothetical protein Pyn_16728 [Prunus yedoensis var. nudiflora]|uniref:Uncharacterized protein n=1 Tax=Prunus yedoensis var. nudiflora TaxID=2094558 RepID=A0A314U7T2_PRUYE|nr:hypothetical protein Pyn_16728 [Prunus yedoensis var. nudiflora]